MKPKSPLYIPPITPVDTASKVTNSNPTSPVLNYSTSQFTTDATTHETVASERISFRPTSSFEIQMPQKKPDYI
jgi:hypothetical protein